MQKLLISRRGLVISLAVALIVLINIFFLKYYSTYSYSFSSDNEYYIVNKDSIGDISLAEGLTPIAHEDILKHLVDKLKNDDSELLNEAKESVKKEFFEIYKQDLKDEIQRDYTKQLFTLLEKSFALYEDLKSEFLKTHELELKDYIVRDILLELKSGNFDLDHALAELNTKFDKKEYYRYLIEDILLANGPKTKKITAKGKSILSLLYKEVRNPIYSRKFLTETRTIVSDRVFKDMQLNHDNVVKMLKELALPSKSVFSGDGIVISSGGKFFAGALVTIGQIRELGSVLPIEVILNYQKEYDHDICENLLPKLNASCVILEKEIGKNLLDKLDLEKFQLKILGLLVSSFDNTIMLDADNMPIKNVDLLLTSEPYLSTKFLLWPDIWHKGTSPIYYDIARFKIGEVVHREGLANNEKFENYVKKDKNNDVMFHDLEGTLPGMGVETGQMVLSKSEHFRSYLLALYYNIYGYSHYYPLLYQGVFGLGDRETFIPALEVFKESYHLTTYDVWLAGYMNEENNFMETTIVQYDAAQSISFFDNWRSWLQKKNLDTRLWPHQDNQYSRDLFTEFKNDPANYALPDIFFLHVHKVKINPIFNTNNNDGDLEVYKRRNMGLPGIYPEFGEQDWELKFHSISKWVACNALSSTHFWKELAKVSRDEICKAVSDYVEFLKKDSLHVESEKLTLPAM